MRGIDSCSKYICSRQLFVYVINRFVRKLSQILPYRTCEREEYLPTTRQGLGAYSVSVCIKGLCGITSRCSDARKAIYKGEITGQESHTICRYPIKIKKKITKLIRLLGRPLIRVYVLLNPYSIA